MELDWLNLVMWQFDRLSIKAGGGKALGLYRE